MAQFKIGEYVTSKERPELGKGRITDEVDFNQYIVRFDDGDESLFEGSDLVAANACAKNGIRSTNAAVNAALNACAKNADKLSKRFGDVEVLAFEDGRLGIRYVITLGGFDEFVNAVSWDDAGKKCAAEARQMASLFEKRASSIKQAAAWLEQNAK